MVQLSALHSAAACAVQKVITCPHSNFMTSGLPTRNRIQQNFGVGEATPRTGATKILRPTGFEDPCRTLCTGAVDFELIHFDCVLQLSHKLRSGPLHCWRLQCTRLCICNRLHRNQKFAD